MMFRYKDKPSLTNRPDKPVTARKPPPSQNPCNHKYKQAATENANELIFFCEKCLDVQRKDMG